MTARKRRVLVACGSGIATSTMVASRLRREFQSRGLEVDITQSTVAEIAAYADDVDLVVVTSVVPQTLTVPVISGIPFLTGIGDQEALAAVLAILGEKKEVA